MSGQSVVETHSGVSFSLKKERNSDTYFNMEGSALDKNTDNSCIKAESMVNAMVGIHGKPLDCFYFLREGGDRSDT